MLKRIVVSMLILILISSNIFTFFPIKTYGTTNLPDGVQTFSGYTFTDGIGLSPDGYFELSAVKDGSPITTNDEIYADPYGAYIIDPSPERVTSYFEIKAVNGLGSFILADLDVGEYYFDNSTPYYSHYDDVVIRGYSNGVEVFSTIPFNETHDGETTEFPIDYTPAKGVSIDSFRVYFTNVGTAPIEVFNLVGFTIGEASEQAPPQNNAINPATTTFDKNTEALEYKDASTSTTLNGNSILDVTLDGVSIGSTNYIFDSSNNKFAIKREYLATLINGDHSFTLDVDAGTDPVFTVKVKDTSPVNSTLNPTTATFDKNEASTGYIDISTSITLNGNTLSDIKLDGTIIGEGNYTYDSNSNTVTIKKEYLATLENGDQIFAFDVSAGTDPTLTVKVSNSSPQDSSLNPTTVTFDRFTESNENADVITNIMLNGNTLNDIKLGGTSIGIDNFTFDSNANEVKIKKEFLKSLGNGNQVFTFDMSAGVDPTLTVNITSSNTNLSDLQINKGTFTSVFSPKSTYYVARVKNAETSVDVTAMLEDSDATMTINGNVVSNGSPQTVSLSNTENQIVVMVTAQDGISQQTYTLDVNRNSLPAVNDTILNVDENASNGTLVGTVGGSDADGDAITYNITGGNEEDIFQIDSNNGVITVANGSLLDYETAKSYNLTVTANDGIDIETASITVNIKDLNDNDPVPTGFSTSIDENIANGTLVGSVSAIDLDQGSGFTYRITGGNTENAFTIDENTGEVKVADKTKLDYETVKSFILTIEVSDGVNKAETTLTIGLNNVNDNTPVITDQTMSVNENASNGTPVGTNSGSDGDGDVITYRIIGGNEEGIFKIDSTTGAISVANGDLLDYETRKSYSLIVEANDGMNLSSATVLVNVKDRNDNTPVPTGFTTSIDENTVNGTLVGTVTSTDSDEGSNFTYRISGGNTENVFSIDENTGEVIVADSTKLDYETVKSFTLKIEVSDGSNTADATLTIGINNVNDNSPDLSNQTMNIDENAQNGSLVGRVNGSDPDGNDITFNITAGNEEGIFTIDSSSGAITVVDGSLLDYETKKSYNISVSASDGKNTSTTTVTIGVNNLNDNSPIISESTFEIEENAENGTQVGMVSGTDADGDVITYNITEGNEEGVFTLNSDTGVITVADGSKLDYETKKSYSLTITADDGKNTSTSMISVNVKDVNDNDPVPTGFSTTINENTTNETLVGSVTSIDMDEGSSLTYRIIEGNTNNAFSINQNTGEVKVADTTILDYEKVKSFTLTIEVSDGTNKAETTLTIGLNNMNDNTPVVSDQEVTVDENASTDTLIGQVSGIDADGDDLSFSITNGNEEGIFKINSSSGAISVADGSLLDYETRKSYSLTVKATDGKNTTTATVTIDVNNLNDSNPKVSDSTFTVNENALKDTQIGVIIGNDPDGDAITYRITKGNENGIFEINTTSGAISVANGSLIDYESKRSYNLTVVANDGVNIDTASVTININNLNDNSPDASNKMFTLNEKASNDTLVGKVSGNDADGDTLTYSIASGNDGGIFTIDNRTGEIKVAKSSLLDSKIRPVYDLTINVNDGMHTKESTVTISLLSSDATLTKLTSSHGNLSQVFESVTNDYSVDVGNQIDRIRLTPTVNQPNATVTINGKRVTSGEASNEILLDVGDNEIKIKVTAQNGDIQVYSVHVKRLQPVVVTEPVQDGENVKVTDEQVSRLDVDGTLLISLKKLDEVEDVVLTKEQLDILKERKATVNVTKEDVQLNIPIQNFDKGGSLTISLEKLDRDPTELPSSNLSTSSIYEFTIRQDGKVISLFDYDIEIVFPIDQLGYEKPEELKVYYWNEHTKKWDLVGGKYEDGKIKANTSHFSTFGVFHPNDLVVKNQPEKSTENQNSGEKSNLPETATNIYNWLFIGLLFFISGVVTLSIQRFKRFN